LHINPENPITIRYPLLNGCTASKTRAELKYTVDNSTLDENSFFRHFPEMGVVI